MQDFTTLEDIVVWMLLLLLAVIYRFIIRGLKGPGIEIPYRPPEEDPGDSRGQIAKGHIHEAKNLVLVNREKVYLDRRLHRDTCADYYLIGKYLMLHYRMGTYCLFYAGHCVAINTFDNMDYLIALARAKSIEKL